MSASGYRPLCDIMMMARPKVAGFYGAFPSGSLIRMRDLLGVCIDDPVLHVCAGMVRAYPFAGFGPNDRTLDLDPKCEPDFLVDARKIGVEPGDTFPDGVSGGSTINPPSLLSIAKGDVVPCERLWPAILIDRPYTTEDAAHYLDGAGAASLPNIDDLLRRCLSLVRPGGRVGVLDYYFPRPPKNGVRLVAVCGVLIGFGNRIRGYYVFERRSTLRADAPSETGMPDDDAPPQASAPTSEALDL